MQQARKTVIEYLTACTWDGSPRLDRWLIDYAGAEDNAYVRAVSRLALVAAVRRAHEPGCAFDVMPMLVGPPRSGKSRVLRVLAVEESWFTDELPLECDGRRFAAATTGKWIVAARKVQYLLSKRAAVSSFKAILSRRRDFGPKDTRVPRQFVIFGTSNETEGFVHAATSNSRFWPVRVRRFDLERLRADRDQLWGEAVAAGKTPLRISPQLFSSQ